MRDRAESALTLALLCILIGLQMTRTWAATAWLVAALVWIVNAGIRVLDERRE